MVPIPYLFFLQVNGRDANNGEEAVPAGQYECDRCGRVYRHRTSLRRHQRQAHTGRRTCPECGEVLQGEESLARHITREHRGRQPDDVVDGELAAIPPPPITGDAAVDRVVSDNWQAIVSRHRIRPVQDIINIRCWDGELQPYQPGVGGNNAWQTLRTAWRRVRYRCKVTVSVGSVLEHRTSGELRYYHASSNNARLFERVKLVSSEADVFRLFADVQRVDLREVAAVQRPSTSWKVRFVTNIKFYLDKLLGAGLV